MKQALFNFDKPILIVGYGLAGTILSWKLWKMGIPFEVIDEKKAYSSSAHAAGIVNPVTGRNYSFTWNYAELWPEAKSFYRSIENVLELTIIRDMPLYRGVYTHKGLNDWEVRASDTAESGVMGEAIEASELSKEISFNADYFGTVSKAFQLNMPLFISSSRNFFEKDGIKFESQKFSYPQLNEKHIEYLGKSYASIIFCEGAFLQENPFFGVLPIVPSKGEVLKIRCESLDATRIIKDRYFICPLFEKGTYWIGSNYDNTWTTPNPSEKMKLQLTNFLAALSITSYDILDHVVGIRPTVPDRKPLVGSSFSNRNIIVFNGLGTKGSSLGPWSAHHLMKYIMESHDLPAEINIARYF